MVCGFSLCACACVHAHACLCVCVGGGLCFKIQANIEQMKSPYLEKHFVVLEKHF